jgi:HD-GYP domain-containing protein (c-di-GMP phosphodiesterase class II)
VSDIWRKLFAVSFDGLFELTPEGRVCDANQTFLTWLGLPHKAVVGHLLSRFVAENSAPPPFPITSPVWAGFLRFAGLKGDRVASVTITPVETGYPNGLRLVGIARMAPDVLPLRETIRRKADELDTTQLVTINALARLAEYQDRDASGHLDRIRLYTYTLASHMSDDARGDRYLADNDIVELSRCAVLHDIGNVAVNPRIFTKPGPLTASERSMMQTHVLFGEKFLAELDAELQLLLGAPTTFVTTAREIALCHHERYDGKGYPGSHTGDAIPLSARIVAVADVYDALTSPRPYRQAWSHARASQYIRTESGGHFDPLVVTAFDTAEDIFAGILTSVQGSPDENVT